MRAQKANPYKRWIQFRKITQIGSLFLFIVLFITGQNWAVSGSVTSFILHLDPLTGFANLISSRVLHTGSLLSLLVLMLTISTGRSWCGWLCPLGTILDIFSFPKQKGNKSTIPDRLYKFKYAILFAILTAAILGNLTLLIFDPLTLLYRTFTVSFYPAFDQLIITLENAFYTLPFLQNFLSTLDTSIRPSILPVQPYFYRDSFVFGLIFLTLILLNRIAARFWCRYICPLGGFLGWISKFSFVRRAVTNDCNNCGLCAKKCPTGAISSDKAFASDPGECTMCMNCFGDCPAKAIRLKPTRTFENWNEHNPDRREAIASISLAAVSVALLSRDYRNVYIPSHSILPPGSTREDFLSQCVRCGLCVRSCPTGALSPSHQEIGLSGLWAPFIIPRIGYCDYSCNACGQVCPVQAIPPLSLDEKRKQIIGKAYIDQDRCIAWSDHIDCIVCEEMCPLPEKAITLEQTKVKNTDGSIKDIKLPLVNRETCIGCGICEFKCPIKGESAIKIYVANQF